jgi:hypothetical protein
VRLARAFSLLLQRVAMVMDNWFDRSANLLAQRRGNRRAIHVMLIALAEIGTEPVANHRLSGLSKFPASHPVPAG